MVRSSFLGNGVPERKKISAIACATCLSFFVVLQKSSTFFRWIVGIEPNVESDCLNLNFELWIWILNLNLNLNFEFEFWIWILNLNFEFEFWIWILNLNFKFKFRIRIANLNFEFERWIFFDFQSCLSCFYIQL